MQKAQPSIVERLLQVDNERRRRESEPKLKAAVQVVKRYQQQRFTRTYADLLGTQRYGAASRFFLDELYGPNDFTQRDAQFMRVAPAVTRLFPSELVGILDTLAQLHSVSESLDSEMGTHVAEPQLDARSYIRAWQSTGRAAERELQIDLTLEIGAALDRYTRKPFLRRALKMMRGAARAAGLGELQRFLEAGFDAFKAMNGADDFLNLVGRRERELAKALFAAVAAAELSDDPVHDIATTLALEHLP